MFDLNKKEKPFTSFSGFGGGGLGLAGGAISAKTYVDDVFSTYLYDGTGSAQTITNNIDISGEGGLVWIKNRDAIVSHVLAGPDLVSAGYTNLASDLTNGGGTETNYVTSFSSNGFTLGNSGSVNSNNQDHVSWTFRKAPGFFDVVTYTGTGSNLDVAHSLGSVPGMVIIKSTSNADPWFIYHKDLDSSSPENYNLRMSTAARQLKLNVWNGQPTSTHIKLGTYSDVNGSGKSYVAYIFAHDDAQYGTDEDESIIKCGVYTGNGSSNGPEINLGFEPQWVMTKAVSQSRDWIIGDVMRGTPVSSGAQDAAKLSANTSNAEALSDTPFVPTPTGFKVRSNSGTINDNNLTYIYMAIRRPHKPPEAAINVFAVDADSASSTIPTWDSGFPVDMSFYFDTLGGGGLPRNSSRLLGSNYLVTSAASSETSDGSLVWDSNVGWGKDYSTNRVYYSHMFRRAPGFFDVVAYTGDGVSGKSISHSLGSVPGLVIIKNRDETNSWNSWNRSITSPNSSWWQNYLTLNTTNAAGSWTTGLLAEPTSASFTVGTGGGVNNSGVNYIAYLFATLPGISKVGSYTGTGSAINVDCGFTAGARFVLIKRTDSTGDWYVWDTARGIVSGNDSYIRLNSATAQVTNTDYVDPFSSGFTVTASAPAALNASGGTYLFLAIA